MSTGKPRAFLLTGSMLAICRAPQYIDELIDRGLKVLLATGSVWRRQAEEATADPDHPASRFADVAFIDGGVDRDDSFTPGLVDAVARWSADYELVGAYAVGETMVEPTGLIADAYGLRFPGLRATRVCRNKGLQRLYLPELAPAYAIVPPGHREEAVAPTYPAVVKPATRHSSSGVETVRNAEELRGLLTTYPEHETLLIEEKVRGREFAVESLVANGDVFFTCVTLKRGTAESGPASTFVELSHTVTGEPGPVGTALFDANRRMLEGLDFQDGMTHAEWRLGEDGHVYLMEVAARPPGDGVPVLYQLATGERFEPALIKIALGEPVTYPAPVRHARQVYPEHTPGELAELSIDWPGISPAWAGEGDLWPDVPPAAVNDPPTLRALLVQKEKGDKLEPLRSSEDRVGSFIIDALTLAELDDLEQRVLDAITIRTIPGGVDER